MTDRFDQIAVRAAITAVPDPVTDDLRTRLRQLPVTLRRCGLPATLAMLMEHCEHQVRTVPRRTWAAVGYARRRQYDDDA
jgi:hypothetical protein